MTWVAEYWPLLSAVATSIASVLAWGLWITTALHRIDVNTRGTRSLLDGHRHSEDGRVIYPAGSVPEPRMTAGP